MKKDPIAGIQYLFFQKLESFFSLSGESNLSHRERVKLFASLTLNLSCLCDLVDKH